MLAYRKHIHTHARLHLLSINSVCCQAIAQPIASQRCYLLSDYTRPSAVHRAIASLISPLISCHPPPSLLTLPCVAPSALPLFALPLFSAFILRPQLHFSVSGFSTSGINGWSSSICGDPHFSRRVGSTGEPGWDLNSVLHQAGISMRS